MTPLARLLLALILLVAAVPAAPQGLHVYQQYVRRILPTYDPAAEVLILGASNMSRWPERSPTTFAATFGASVTSAASPGWTTSILRSHLPLVTEARVIVIGDLGSPDLAEGRSPADAADGVRHAVEELLATTDAEIVVVLLPPRLLWDEDACDAIAETNWWIRGLLGWRPRVTLVEPGVPHHRAYYLADGSHLSPSGYEFLANALAPTVARLGDR